jgi:hypothetical protein
MRRTRPLSLLTAPAVALLACCLALTAAPASAATNLLANPGFEAGSLSGWTCSPLGSVVTSPVHSGSYALAGAASSSDDAQCSQQVSVQPSSSYTLAGWVEGDYVFLGDSGTGTSDTSTWTAAAGSWQQLSTSFSTGASTTSVTIYVHGWYSQGTYYADDLSLTFDIEGAEIAYTAQNNLRFQAINALEAANPGLVVSVTIPVNPNGPDANGQAFLQEAKTNGTRIDVINVMTMDYYGTWDTGSVNMGSYAVEAAQDTLGYAQTLWPSMSYTNIGVTPMIGQNDDPAEVFTEANAQTLVSFAEQNHLGRLAFWSVDRDQPCGGSASGLSQCSEISQQPLDFTRIFAQYTG